MKNENQPSTPDQDKTKRDQNEKLNPQKQAPGDDGKAAPREQRQRNR